MSPKSVSLFEVLPPSGSKKEEQPRPRGSGASPSAQAQPPASESTERAAEPAAATKSGRLSVSDDQDFSSPVLEKPREDLDRHRVEGVSVRRKDDHFPLIILIMLGLSVLTFVAGYRYGQRKGVELAFHQLQPGAQSGQGASSSAPPATRPSETDLGQASSHRNNPVEILPTQLKQLRPEQAKAVAPVTPPKIYTLQIQTFGRHQQENIDDLLTQLRSSGYEAFADYGDGAVFVGRLESTRGDVASRLKNEVARFNWRKRDFSNAYFRRIPNHLLEK